jgi:signal transduction histidine kinase
MKDLDARMLQLLESLSDSLKTPTENILGFAELVRSPLVGTLTGKQDEYLRDILESANVLLGSINDLITLVRQIDKPSLH